MRQRHAPHAVLLIFALLVPTALIGFATTPASAATSDFEFESMSSDFYLGRDDGGNATLRTVETLVAVFPDYDQNHGIERAIPLTYGDVQLDVQIVGVTGDNGASMPYSRTDDGGFAILRIGSAASYVHGTVTYRIEYTQRNVVRFFTNTQADEFYWDVNGTGWAQPFGSVSATVHLADGIADALTGEFACYRGYEGSTDRCDIERNGTVVTAQTSDLLSGQNMTIAIGFEPSTFADPPILKDHWAFAILPWVLLGLTGAALIIVFLVRFFVWRDAKGRGIIIPQYTPLKDAYPMLAAELLGRKPSALPAQIVRFAVAKVLAIREHPDKPKSQRYELELLAGWPTAPENEKWVLTTLFGDVALGRKVVLNPSNVAIGDRMAKQQNHVSQEVDVKGWRATPTSKIPRVLRWSTFAIAVAALAIRFISAGLDVDPPGIALAAVWCLVGWIVVSIAATPNKLITESGAEVRDYLYGIRDYISLAESDRIRVLQAPGTAERIDITDESAVIKLYEKLLPYAMIFGIEKEWIAELGRHYSETEQPDWYSGGSDIAAVTHFGAAMTGTRFATTPPPPTTSGSSWSSSGGGSSSSSGGSSGGGSSGGGGGGGGGGGW
jgi:uncharacterized membrane protein YgcG